MRNKFQAALLIFGLLALSWPSAFASAPYQTKEGQDKAQEKKEEPKPAQQSETPPDRKAYNEAIKISDAAEKIEALKKFKADFPHSPGVTSASQQIFQTALKAWPDDKEKIMALAKEYIGPPPHDDKKTGNFNFIADRLMDAGIFLDEAEKFAKEGISLFDKAKYIETQKKMYETRKQPVPADEELEKRFLSSRALNITTLGEIYLKQGKIAEAEKFLKEAYDDNPSIMGAVVGLAEVAEKKGNDAAAFEYFSIAALGGRMTADNRKKFEALYRKLHNGALDGLEEMLDAKYKKEFPNPLKLEHYKATDARADRAVLAEIFTGSGCPPCVAADLAFEAMMERYSPKELIVIMYHLHIPRPDPMTNPSTLARSKFYGVGGVPSFAIDGSITSGGGPREATEGFYKRVNPGVEKRLETASEAHIALKASLEEGAVKVKATVDKVQSESKDIKLQIALVEDHLTYSGENGVRYHPMVVRSLGGPEAGGFALDKSKANTVEHTFNIAEITKELKAHLDDYEVNGRHGKITFSQKKHEIDADGLSVVAFVEDAESKKILQAVYVKVKPDTVTPSK